MGGRRDARPRMWMQPVSDRLTRTRTKGSSMTSNTETTTTGLEIQFWGDEHWTPDGCITIPKGYVWLAAGDAYMTRMAKKLTKENKKPIYVERHKLKRRGYSRDVGIWVPKGVLARV